MFRLLLSLQLLTFSFQSTFSYSSESFGTSDDCCICLDSLEKTTTLTFRSCKHIIHPACLKDWIREHYKNYKFSELCELEEVQVSCPLCRESNTITDLLPLFFSEEVEEIIALTLEPFKGTYSKLVLDSYKKSFGIKSFQSEMDLVFRALLQKPTPEIKKELVFKVLVPAFQKHLSF